jgi:hypothetical protein
VKFGIPYHLKPTHISQSLSSNEMHNAMNWQIANVDLIKRSLKSDIVESFIFNCLNNELKHCVSAWE